MTTQALTNLSNVIPGGGPPYPPPYPAAGVGAEALTSPPELYQLDSPTSAKQMMRAYRISSLRGLAAGERE
jgi:hypothetical protein